VAAHHDLFRKTLVVPVDLLVVSFAFALVFVVDVVVASADYLTPLELENLAALDDYGLVRSY
jgi:hypothetical protein